MALPGPEHLEKEANIAGAIAAGASVSLPDSGLAQLVDAPEHNEEQDSNAQAECCAPYTIQPASNRPKAFTHTSHNLVTTTATSLHSRSGCMHANVP